MFEPCLLLLLLMMFAGEDCLWVEPTVPVRADGAVPIPYMRCSRRNDSSLNLLPTQRIWGAGWGR